MDGTKNLHALFLASDKSIIVSPLNLRAFSPHRSHNFLFHFLLRRPALPVRRRPQVAAGDQNHRFAHKLSILTCPYLSILRIISLVGKVPDLSLENSKPPALLLFVSFYRRKLPHWQPEGRSIFLTWRLYGSVPRNKVTHSLTEGQRFLLIDQQLDTADYGPVYLKNPQVAATVEQTLFTAANKWELFDLFAWVVMSNHVHVLLQPYKPVQDITRAVKNTSARNANAILGRTGQPFWQTESFDHWVRNGKQFDRILQYIEENPVKAGLVERAEQWPWSSATVGQVPDLSLVPNLPK
jgi:putative transposase